MGLLKRSTKQTNFVLGVEFINGYKTFWYYEYEKTLFKAYRQLKGSNVGIKPSYPIVYENKKEKGE